MIFAGSVVATITNERLFEITGDITLSRGKNEYTMFVFPAIAIAPDEEHAKSELIRIAEDACEPIRHAEHKGAYVAGYNCPVAEALIATQFLIEEHFRQATKPTAEEIAWLERNKRLADREN